MSNRSAQRARVDLEVSQGVAWLTLCNPERRNAITLDMASDLVAHADQISADEKIGAAVILGAGDYFCSGADTKDLTSWASAPSSPEAVSRISAIYGAFTRFGALPVPTAAVVVGGAVGAGMNMMMAADIALVASDASIESAFAKRGLHPGGGHFSLLGRSLSRQKGAAVGLFGVPLSGMQAVDVGLAWEAHPAEMLRNRAAQIVAPAAADPMLARRMKDTFSLQYGPPALPWPAAVELERGVQMWSMARSISEP